MSCCHLLSAATLGQLGGQGATTGQMETHSKSKFFCAVNSFDILRKKKVQKSHLKSQNMFEL